MTTSTPKRTQCHGCRQSFATGDDFKAHIRFNTDKAKHGGQCMTTAEMNEVGLKNLRGYWQMGRGEMNTLCHHSCQVMEPTLGKSMRICWAGNQKNTTFPRLAHL